MPAPVEMAIHDAIRSIERGKGNNAPKDAFRLDVLSQLSHAMVVLGSWFLSGDRTFGASRQTHMALDPARNQVCLTLSASKTDTVGSIVQRRHSCYCGTVSEAICPYHAALRIADHNAPVIRRPSCSPGVLAIR